MASLNNGNTNNNNNLNQGGDGSGQGIIPDGNLRPDISGAQREGAAGDPSALYGEPGFIDPDTGEVWGPNTAAERAAAAMEAARIRAEEVRNEQLARDNAERIKREGDKKAAENQEARKSEADASNMRPGQADFLAQLDRLRGVGQTNPTEVTNATEQLDPSWKDPYSIPATLQTVTDSQGNTKKVDTATGEINELSDGTRFPTKFDENNNPIEETKAKDAKPAKEYKGGISGYLANQAAQPKGAKPRGKGIDALFGSPGKMAIVPASKPKPKGTKDYLASQLGKPDSNNFIGEKLGPLSPEEIADQEWHDYVLETAATGKRMRREQELEENPLPTLEEQFANKKNPELEALIKDLIPPEQAVPVSEETPKADYVNQVDEQVPYGETERATVEDYEASRDGSQTPVDTASTVRTYGPKRDQKKWEPDHARDTERRDKSIARIKQWFEIGYFTVEDQVIEKDGVTVTLPDKVQHELDATMDFFGLESGEEWAIFNMISHYWGMTPDRQDRLFMERDKGEGNKFKKSDRVEVGKDFCITAMRQMRKKCLQKGTKNPLMFDYGDFRHRGSKRFPLPLLDDRTAALICNDRPNNMFKMDAEVMQREGLKDWSTRVLPNIHLHAEPDQKEVLLDAMDAIEQMNHSQNNYSGRMPDSDYTVREMYSELNDFAAAFDTDGQTQEANYRSEQRLRKAADMQMKKKVKAVYNEDGTFKYLKDVKENPTAWFLKSTTETIRAGGCSNVVLAIPAAVEHGFSNIKNNMASSMLCAVYHRKPATKTMKDIASLDEVQDILDDANGIIASGYRDILVTRLAAGEHLGGKKMTKSLSDELKQQESLGAKAKVVIQRSSHAYMHIASIIASGRFVLRHADNMRFIEMLWFNIQETPGNTITEKQFESMLTNDPRGTIEFYLQQAAGLEAMAFMLDNTIGANNIVTEFFQRQMAKHSITELMWVLFVNKFTVYSINFIIRIAPFSHTVLYTAAHLKAKYSDNKASVEDLNIGGNAALYDEKFWRGFAKNLIIDAAWTSSNCIMTMFIWFLLGLFKVDPPDDPEKLYCYEEWKIGGVPLKLNWIFRDLLGWAMPVAIALRAQEQGYDGFKLFQDGIMTVLSGNPLLKMSGFSDILINWDANLVKSQEDLDEQWGDEQPGTLEYIVTKAEVAALEAITTVFLNSNFKTLYGEAGTQSPENDAASASMIYTRDENGKIGTKRTDWADAQFRKLGRTNQMAGDFLNLINGIWIKNEGEIKTGYRKEQMPKQQYSDPYQQMWIERWTLPDKYTEEDKIAMAQDVINELGSHESLEDLLAYGIVIPYEARQNAIWYNEANINAIKNRQKQDFGTPGFYTQNGLNFEENKLARDQRVASDWQEIQKLMKINSKLWDGRIPMVPNKQNMPETDWRAMYKWKDSGEPATSMDWANPFMKSKIEQTWYASGDHKSSLTPFLTVENPHETYDAQTPVDWSDQDRVSMDQLHEKYDGQTLKNGIHKGKDLGEMLDAGGNSDVPLLGQRGLTQKKEYDVTPKLVSGKDSNAWQPLGDMGKEGFITDQVPTNRAGGSSYGGSGGYAKKSYSSGGGGGGGKAIIYSHAANSINGDKAATMYSKTPYESRYDYLRPGFSTKGSREAYKRQDI